MKIANHEVFCEKYHKKFVTIKFSFDYLEDKSIIDKLISEGESLANKLNPVLARDSSRSRKFETVLSNAISGVISEYCWRYWLNKKAIEKNSEALFNKVEMTDSKNQIDIECVCKNNVKKLIEVRSSFPYTGIQNAVCKVFDVIGWYANHIKTKEIKKDFYVRALFPYRSSDFLLLLKVNFSVYLCGGASKHFLENSIHAKYKNFIPYDELVSENIKYTKYKVIEPIINAKDSIKVTEELIN